MSSPYLAIFNILLFIFLSYIYVIPVYYKQNKLYRQKYSNEIIWTGLFIFVTLFCVFAYTSADFYHYRNLIGKMTITHKNKHFETIYYWLLCNINFTYFVWRFIVWGLATFLMIQSLKRLAIPARYSCCAVVLFYLTTIYVFRGSLGIAIMFYGITLLFNPIKTNHLFSYLLGLILIVISYYFHRSMPLLFALIPLSFIKPNKKIIILSILLFPVMVFVTGYILEYIILNGVNGMSDDFSNKAISYSKTDIFEINIKGYIRKLFIYGPVYLSLFYVTKKTVFEKNVMPLRIRFFYMFWYLMVYVATVCNFQSTGGWFFPRFMYMSNFPFAVVMAYIFDKYPINRFIKFIIIIGFLGCMYDLSYSMYSQIGSVE